MTAIEPLPQRGPEPPRPASAGNVYPLPTPGSDSGSVLSPVRPPRWNLAGYCLYCFAHHCDSVDCDEHHRRSLWVICRHCDGSGYNTAAERVCSCQSGVENLTASTWPTTPTLRPPRLNLAGWCLWCITRWCESPACVARHHVSTWEVCDLCDGTVLDQVTGETCCCGHGLQELT